MPSLKLTRGQMEGCGGKERGLVTLLSAIDLLGLQTHEVPGRVWGLSE